MRVPRIYTPQSLAPGATVALAEAASHYLTKVLRMQAGRPLIVFNGQGGEYRAEISQVDKKHAQLVLGDFNPENRQSPLQVELAIGISRGERMDWVLQKATELGVTKITPLLSERTEVKLNAERELKKMAHWHQIVISACEQCQRNILPELAPPTGLSTWIEQCQAQVKLVLHHRDQQRLTADQSPQSLALLIGPEGGLEENEIDAAEAQGFVPLTLGPRVLRTETAPVAALSLVQYLWGDI